MEMFYNLIIPTATFATIFLLLLFWKRKISQFNFPGPPIFPFLGCAPYLKLDSYELGLQIREYIMRDNFLCLVWVSFWPILLSGRADCAEIVLKGSKHLNKSNFYDFLHEWLGTGLLTSNGVKWKKRRKALTPSFHFAILSKFTNIINEEAKKLVDQFNLVADTKQPIDVQRPVSLAALDIICQTAMGVKVNAQEQESCQYVTAILSLTSHLHFRQRYPWLWPNFIYKLTPYGQNWYKDLKTVHDYTVDVIQKRIQSRKENTENKQSRQGKDLQQGDDNKQKAFLDTLLDLYDQGEIDVEGIREEVDTFMFEGHDTTASAIGWTLYLLGRYPEVQKRLQREIDANFVSYGNKIEKVRDLKYLDCVIKEGLRLHPPVPLFARILDEDIEIEGQKLPKGTSLAVATTALHLNPEYWEDPETFNPDRFMEEKFLNRHPYSYIPFSAGPRNCIGKKFALLEQRYILYHILLNFNLNSVQSEQDVRVCFEIIQKSDNGLMIQFTRRESRQVNSQT